MTRTKMKLERHKLLLEKLEKDPFLTDEELASALNVSVPTIRIDRAKLGILEYRERVKDVARAIHAKTRISNEEIVDLNLLKDGLSMLVPDKSMTFDNRNHWMQASCFKASGVKQRQIQTGTQLLFFDSSA